MEPRVHVGGPLQILPLVTGIVKNSPATHLHPEDIDIENESDADDDAGGYFNIISDFKGTHQNNFVFIHININSFRHKFVHLQEILSKHRVDYLAISESKLDDSFPDAQFNVQGYNIFRQDNTSSSGGLIIYV